MFSDTMMLGGGVRKAAFSVENSLLFRGGQYLSRTPSVDAAAQKCAISFWDKSAGDPYGTFFMVGPSNADYQAVYLFNGSLWYQWIVASGGVTIEKRWDLGAYSSASSGFRHFYVELDSSAGVTFADHAKAWVNGVPLGAPAYTSTNGTYAGVPMYFGSTRTHWIGRNPGATAYSTAYLAQPFMAFGAAPGVAKFGEMDAVTGSWRPKKTGGVTLGTNGCSLGAPWNVADLGKDYGNTTTPYAIDPSTKGSLVTLSNGGLTVNTSASAGQGVRMNAFGTDRVYAGKRVFEFKVEHVNAGVGVAVYPGTADTVPTNFCLRYASYIQITGGSQPTSSLATLAVGDVVRVEFDASAGACKFYKNGAFEYTVTGLAVGVAWRPYYAVNASGVSSQGTFRFDPATFTSGTPTAGYTQWISGNNWTPSGFVASDVVVDTPTNMYPTFNPLDKGQGSKTWFTSLSNGNLTANFASDAVRGSCAIATLPFPVDGQDGFYYEFNQDSAGGSGYGIMIGLGHLNYTAYSYYDNAEWLHQGLNQGNGCYSVAVKNGKVWWAKNGVWRSGDPAAGTSPTLTGLTAYRFPVAMHGDNAGAVQVTANFGQRPFAYTPPAGFKALCTANLPATTGQLTGTFTGNGSADGPCVYTGAVPVTLSINGNTVVWGTHADKLATGFKIRTASAAYNTTSNNWVATYNKQPTVGSNHTPATAQVN